MSKIYAKHPFKRRLLKRSVTVIVLWNVVVLCALGTGITFAIIGAILTLGEDGTYTKLYGDGTNKLLSIPIKGEILGSDGVPESSSNDSRTYGYDVRDKLEAAADDDMIKGVILEIDSPGGTLYGARAITDAVKAYRDKTHNPVYAHINGTGASAAYWSAVSADKVFADYGSDVGSIGVIMGPFEYYDKVIATDGGLAGGGVITQNGIEQTYITAGKSKDVGNPFRRLTADETKVLQQSVNKEYDNFIQYVSQRRSIPVETIRTQIGALGYDPQTAKDFKMIDEIANLQTAYKSLATAAHIADDYSVVYEEGDDDSSLDGLMAAFGRKPAPKAEAKTVDLCPLTRQVLAYNGDISGWCSKSD